MKAHVLMKKNLLNYLGQIVHVRLALTIIMLCRLIMCTTFSTRFTSTKKSNVARCVFDIFNCEIGQCGQKLDIILENKVIRKLKLSKNVNTKSYSSNLKFLKQNNLQQHDRDCQKSLVFITLHIEP